MALHKAKKHESMEKQEVNSALIVTTGAISLIILVVSSIGLEAWFRYEEEQELAEKWSVSQNAWLHDIRDKQEANLAGYKWTDASKKSASIPIDQAMALVAQNQGKTR